MNSEEYLGYFFKDDYHYSNQQKILLRNKQDLIYYIKNVIPLSFFAQTLNDNTYKFEDACYKVEIK